MFANYRDLFRRFIDCNTIKNIYIYIRGRLDISENTKLGKHEMYLFDKIRSM